MTGWTCELSSCALFAIIAIYALARRTAMPIDNPASVPAALRSVSAPELMAMDLPKPRAILEPILSTKSLVLLYGPRGIGKTFLALGIAWAAATGGRFLGWQAPQPARVVYVDGEMAAAELRDRM